LANYQRILNRLVGSGINGAKARKALSLNKPITVALHGKDVILKAVLSQRIVHLKAGDETIAKAAYVPIDELDVEYEKRLQDDTLMDDELFLEAYFERFKD
tara:strand:- start:2692 stop:2994 length:303 start_codon:yes stop_codon:yes gene_type:complete